MKSTWPERPLSSADHSAVMCHGPAGEGNPTMVKMSKGAMHDLKSPEVQKLSDDELKKKIAGGYGTKKPLKPALTDEQMKEIIAHVRGMAKK